MPAWIVAQDREGVTIAVQVVPRARRSEVAGPQGERLKVRVAAPPVEGAANEALLAFLAGANSIFVGATLLTTPNPERSEDDILMADLGLTAMPVGAGPVAH